ncbi:HAD family hydrolase [Candidatus Pacearchaeota archaeon]|nr:MAG: HAD family hydrolase [Candidatus Pacearchaeota archaeon]
MKVFLLFDIDGTLINTGGAGLRSLKRAFKDLYNKDNAHEGIRTHGNTDIEIIKMIFKKHIGINPPQEKVKEAIEKYVYYLKEEVWKSKNFIVYDGIKEFLENKPSWAICGLGTGNVKEGAKIKLERVNLWKYFKFGGFGDDGKTRVELLTKAYQRGVKLFGKPNKVVVIGDTPKDVIAGKKLGFKVIGLSQTIYSKEDLLKYGADFVFDSIKPLLKMPNFLAII